MALRPGRLLIAAALAGLGAAMAIAATAGGPAIRIAPADDPAATSQYTPVIGPAAKPSPAGSSASPAPTLSPSAGTAAPPAISTAAAWRVLAAYWAANNHANQARSDALLARIEAGTSYQMDAGAYRTGQAGSRYTPVTSQNLVVWIPRQPAGTWPRWFAARVTYTGEGAGYLVFTQPRAGAPWKNVLEPYLLPGTGPGPFVITGTQGYAALAAPGAAGLAVSPEQIGSRTAASLDGAATAVADPGNLADLRDEAYLAAQLPPGSAAGDRHAPGGAVFAVQTVGGGVLAFYSLTATVTLTPPPGQALAVGIPGYYTPAQPQTSAVTISYVEQFAAYLPPGHARPRLLADASGIAG